jgi:NhaA family Na+:H+ antiporter
MHDVLKRLKDAFAGSVGSELSGPILLVISTVLALSIANSPYGSAYASFWQVTLGAMSLEHWVNDGLMAIFFLLIGLELERELYDGELASPRKALLPIVAAIGGMLAPALIHYGFNANSATQGGFGIPMATDIAFALGVLALLGRRAPVALRIFVVAFAVIDDLGAIMLIAIFYTAQVSISYLLSALAVWAILIVLNRFVQIVSLTPYLAGGALMWFLMLKSGVHATISGVLLAFAIPFSRSNGVSPSARLEHALHRPSALIILPLFALANAGILVQPEWYRELASANSVGILAGLIVGKPLGVAVFCLGAITLGVCELPAGMKRIHLLAAGILGGIGFTMAIFIANLAFGTSAEVMNSSKIAILLASLISGVSGFLLLRVLPATPPGAQ